MELAEEGSAERRDHTVLGPAVNIAARLCATAGPVEAIVSASVSKNVVSETGEAPFQFGPIEALQLKGLPAPMPSQRLQV